MADLEHVLRGSNDGNVVRDLAAMLLIRETELLVATEAGKRTFGTPIHLAIGQEAIAVGITKFLRVSDSIFGNHRSHAHFLATGAPIKSLFSEILGRKSGASGGKGGSMHLKSPSTGLIGTMPIVGGTIPIAVGAALSKRRANNSEIAVIYFGDGAAEEGVFHESLNLARILKLPILFVCENNIYSSHLHIEERQPLADIRRFANAHDIENFSVDGNSLEDVSITAGKAIKFCRERREPVMIEAHTYRLYGHVGYQKDENVGLRRFEELPEWEKRDPILLEVNRLVGANLQTLSQIEKLLSEIRIHVADVWAQAEKEVYPPQSDLLSNVYFKDSK